MSVLAVLRGEWLGIPRAAVPSFAGQAAATLVISVGYLASVQFIPVGLASVIFFTFPVLIMLASPVIEGHSPGPLSIAVAVFAFLGLAVAIGPSFDKLDFRGILLAAAASLCCTLQFFSGRSLSRHMPSAAFSGLVHLAIWPATLLIALSFGSWKIQFFPGGPVSGIGYAALFGVGCIYVVAYFVHMSSLRFAPASTVAPFYNLEPVVSTTVAAFLLGERLAINQYAGGGMVLAALMLSSFLGSRRNG
jgi:drug/metabolite transporter (DMT)-like permease